MDVSQYNVMLPINISNVIKERGMKNNAVAKMAGYYSQQCSMVGKLSNRVISWQSLMLLASMLGICSLMLVNPAHEKSQGVGTPWDSAQLT